MKMIWKKQKALPALFFLILVFCLYMPFENGARAASTTDAKSMYSYVLGDAVNYGIVTETFTLNGDAETNLAAKNLVPKNPHKPATSSLTTYSRAFSSVP